MGGGITRERLHVSVWDWGDKETAFSCECVGWEGDREGAFACECVVVWVWVFVYVCVGGGVMWA